MAGRSALIGRYAEASIGGVLIALLFDWKVTYHTQTVDLPAGGDIGEYPVPIRTGWTFTAKAYVVPASVTHLLEQLWHANSLPGQITIAGFSGSVATGTKIFQGIGYATEGELAAPMEMATQTFTVKGWGTPSVGVS